MGCIMNKLFVEATLMKQLELARRVRDVQNAERVLFGNFVPVPAMAMMIDKIRVDVDRYGRQGLLCAGAQKAFDFQTYMSYMSAQKDVVIKGDVIVLLKK